MVRKILGKKKSMQEGSPQENIGSPNQSSTSYPPIRPKMKTSTKIIVGIIIVIFVLAIIIGIAFLSYLGNYPRSNVQMEVLDSEWGSYNYFAEKYEYTVTVRMTNDRSSEIQINPFGFSIITANGTSYAANPMVADTTPDELLPGGTATFTIGFLLPENEIPEMLEFDYMLVDVECDIP